MSVVEKFHRKLDHFSIAVEDWEILDQGVTVLWGASGSGKSSLLRGLMGFDKQAEVRWIVNGENIAEKPIGDRALGAVFQEPSLFPNMSAQDNILFPVDRKKQSQWKRDFQFLVDSLELGHVLKSPIHKISGGEQQRVAIARALIYRPKILLLDEPFSSLDELVRAKVRQLLARTCSELKCPALLVTHDRGDVQALGAKVSQIEAGKIIEESSVQDFMDSSKRD